jgi:hypothetical protein
VAQEPTTPRGGSKQPVAVNLVKVPENLSAMTDEELAEFSKKAWAALTGKRPA